MNTAAGFLIYFNNAKGTVKNMPRTKLILVLEDINGKGDFPKGVLEKSKNESLIQCAIRETKEETGLVANKDFKIKSTSCFYNKSGLHIFLAEILCLNNKLPEINFIKNPETHIVEHTKYYWLTYDKAYLLLPAYLKKFLKVYKEKIND